MTDVKCPHKTTGVCTPCADLAKLRASLTEAERQRDEIASMDIPLWKRLLALAKGDDSFGRSKIISALESRFTDLEKQVERERACYVERQNLVARSLTATHTLLTEAEKKRDGAIKAFIDTDTELSSLIEECGAGVAKIKRLETKLAEVEKRERSLKTALEDIATWRAGCWDHDEDVGHERRDFPDEENWELVEGSASRTLTMVYPPKDEDRKE